MHRFSEPLEELLDVGGAIVHVRRDADGAETLAHEHRHWARLESVHDGLGAGHVCARAKPDDVRRVARGDAEAESARAPADLVRESAQNGGHARHAELAHEESE